MSSLRANNPSLTDAFSSLCCAYGAAKHERQTAQIACAQQP
jgi:hypothetical protein